MFLYILCYFFRYNGQHRKNTLQGSYHMKAKKFAKFASAAKTIINMFIMADYMKMRNKKTLWSDYIIIIANYNCKIKRLIFQLYYIVLKLGICWMWIRWNKYSDVFINACHHEGSKFNTNVSVIFHILCWDYG